ncbi:high chlorophyll fluorescence 153 [Wolffia australiana]
MAAASLPSFSISKPFSPSFSLSSGFSHLPSIAFTRPPIAVRLSRGGGFDLDRPIRHGSRRIEGFVVRAGPPSASTLAFAFVFPLSMVLGTVFASIRIADQLDEKYLQELSRNGSEMVEKEDENGGKDDQFITVGAATSIEESSSAPRRRNRPKREA